MREAMRIFFYWKTYHPTYFEFLILTDEEVLFYNFIFALIASIFGLSACFRFWFHRAKRYNENSIRYFRQSSIFTDVTGLNAIFLHWFARVAFVFAIFGGMYQTWCYFQLYPAWNFFWVLLIVVLFMEMWKTIRKVAFRESRRWILLSVSGIVVWSLILSKIQLVDYKGINDAYFNSSITLKYHIEYPKSDYYRKIEHRNLTTGIHLCFPFGVAMDSLPKVFVNQKESGFEYFHEKIEEALQNYSEVDKRLANAVLHIDRQMPMKHVKMLKKQLSCAKLLRIGYRIFPSNMDNCSNSIPYAISVSIAPCNASIPNQEELNDFSQFTIKLKSTGIYIEEQLQEWRDMEDYLYGFMVHHANYLIVLDIDDDCIYDEYIKVYSTVFKVVSNLRDEKSLEKYEKQFDDLTSDQQDEIRERYGLRIYDQTNFD